jgi:2-polyprenyl-3-methyl-5-hydroxy-6-metoxy-1,4-benzoquinol methylase
MDMNIIFRRIGKLVAYYLTTPKALFEREHIIRTTSGVAMICYAENYIERNIILTGQWEPSETSLVMNIVKPGYICLDVGANVGYFSLLMAKLGGLVHAYEPTTWGFNRMQANIDLNSELSANILVNKCALSDKNFELEEAIEA